MRTQHLNYVILSDGVLYYLFERLGKETPFSAYSRGNALSVGESVEEILENYPITKYEIEETPYEVIFK